MFSFGHLNWETTITSESVISQYPELLIINVIVIILDVTNFDVGGHPSNIKIDNLNITKLSTYIKRLCLFFIIYLIICLIFYCLSSAIYYLLCIFNFVNMNNNINF